jgi:hypothetical protein
VILKSIMIAVTVPTLIAYGQGTSVNRGNPAGPGRIVTAPQRGAASDSELSALSPLIGATSDQLRPEYFADNQLCAVPFRPYVALRLAEKKFHFDRADVLRQMCARRTTSFALALQSAGGVYGTLTSPGPQQNQELRDAERDFLRQIDMALRARSQGR